MTHRRAAKLAEKTEFFAFSANSAVTNYVERLRKRGLVTIMIL